MEPLPATGLFERIVKNYSEVICYLDQVIIHCRQRKDIVEGLPVYELNKYCHYFAVQWPDSNYVEHGYLTRLSVSVPSKEFWLLLEKYQYILKDYKITRVEVAKDIITPHLSLSSIGTLIKKILKSITVTYVRNISEFDVSKMDFEEWKNIESDKGDITGYLKTKTWALVLYARESKYTGKNCLHLEWRYLNAPSVKSKMRTYTIMAMAFFNPENHWKEKELSLCLKEIDRERFGKFLKGIHGKRNLDSCSDQL